MSKLNKRYPSQIEPIDQKKAVQLPSKPVAEDAAAPRRPSWLPSIVALISLVSVVLCLTGLGVAFSIDTNFAVPYATVFGSGFELLQLSVWGISQFIVGLSEALRDVRLYWSLLTDSWPLLLGVFFSWTLLAILGKTLLRSSRKNTKDISRMKKWFQLPSFQTESVRMLLGQGLLFSVLAAVTGPFLVLAAVIGIAFVCSVIAILPILAMAAGDAHIRDYVVGPEKCARLVNRTARMQWAAEQDNKRIAKKGGGKVANCVNVIHDAEVIGSGRVVFATSYSAVLYSPDSGTVRRVPLKDSVIEVVEKL